MINGKMCQIACMVVIRWSTLREKRTRYADNKQQQANRHTKKKLVGIRVGAQRATSPECGGGGSCTATQKTSLGRRGLDVDVLRAHRRPRTHGGARVQRGRAKVQAVVPWGQGGRAADGPAQRAGTCGAWACRHPIQRQRQHPRAEKKALPPPPWEAETEDSERNGSGKTEEIFKTRHCYFGSQHCPSVDPIISLSCWMGFILADLGVGAGSELLC